MIRVEAPADYGPLDKVAEAGTYDWIVFTSANAVDFFLRRSWRRRDIRDLNGSSSSRLGLRQRPPRTQGLRSISAGQRARRGNRARAAGDGGHQGKRFLLRVRTSPGKLLPEELRKSGADVTE